MKLVERITEKLLITDYEDFTGFIITALSIAKAEQGFKQKDVERIEWLKDNTHEDLMISIFKLDRKVDPSKVTDDPTKFVYNLTLYSDKLIDPEDETRKREIKLSSDDLQVYLCNAILEVNKIVYSNIWAYNEDFIIPKMEDEGDNNFEN